MQPSELPPRSDRWQLRWTVPLLIAAIPLVAILGLRARASLDWPREMPPQVDGPLSPYPIDKDAWPMLERALKATPSNGTVKYALRDILRSGDVSHADEALAPYQAALALFDAAITRGGFELGSSTTDPVFPPGAYLGLTDAWLLRAQRRNERMATVRDLDVLVRFSSRLSQAGSLTTLMLARESERRAADQIDRLRTSLGDASANVLAPLELALDADAAFPSGIARAMASECRAQEMMLRDLTKMQNDELAATTSGRGSPLWNLVPRSFLLSEERTVSVARERCHAILSALAVDGSHLPMPDIRELSVTAPWSFVDNRWGRVLLSMNAPSYEAYVKRDDDILASRRGLRIALAIQRFIEEQHALPNTLGDLAPRYLKTTPSLAVNGRTLQWNAAAKTLSVVGPMSPPDPPMTFEWRFGKPSP